MAMNVQGGGEEEVMSNINTTPLVDVMLVLLIIFIITTQVAKQAIKVDLPDAVNQATQTKPENILIIVDKDGKVYWNSAVPIENDELLKRLEEQSVLNPQPEVHIRGDKNVRYEFIGRVVVDCQRAGIHKVGFISQPKAGAAAQVESQQNAAAGGA